MNLLFTLFFILGSLLLVFLVADFIVTLISLLGDK